MPDWSPEIRRRLAAANLRPEREAEIATEIGQHLEDRLQSLLAEGRSPLDAEQGAWRELDETDAIARRLVAIEAAPPPSVAAAEASRGGGLTRGFWQDVRYGARSLRKRPLLSLTVIATIALSLGPTTAVLGMAESLFFRPLPGISRQDRLLNVWFGTPATGRGGERGITPWFVSYANVADMTRSATTIAAIAGWQTLGGAGLAAEGKTAGFSSGASVSSNYFNVLGVVPIAGRVFRPEEDRTPGGEPVVVLGETPARGFFGSPDAAIGRPVLINSIPFTVIGVAPRDFAGADARTRVDFWIPGMADRRARHWPQARWAYPVNEGPFYAFIVRMKDEATVPQTTAELEARSRLLAQQDPALNKRFETIGPIVQPGFAAPASLRPTAVRVIELIAAAAGVLALLGIANVANLLIFRGLGAAREIAIRKALGASARRLVQLRLVESLLLALAGAIAGVGVAAGLGFAFAGFAPPAVGPIDVTMNWRVLAATAAVALLAGVGFGVAPAMLAVRDSVTGALGRGTRTDPIRTARLRHVLAAVQIALSLTLLVGALLFLATLRNLHAVDLGFDPANVTVVNLPLRNHGYADARALDYERRLVEAVGRTPGVRSAALAYAPPLFGATFIARVYQPGEDPKEARDVIINAVSAGYFETLGLPLARGRAFTDEETYGEVSEDAMPVVLSETLARAFFGTTDATGRELRMPVYQSSPKTLRVVGVARDVHFRAVDSPPDAVLYEPLSGFPGGAGGFVLASSDAGPGLAARAITQGASRIDPAMPLAPDRTIVAVIDQHLGEQRLFARLLSLLGIIGFALAAVGLHGLVAQTVTERRREFGIRLAIGADRWQVVRPVARQAARLAAAGLVAGLVLAWFSGRLLETRLFGVTSRDPLIYLAAAIVMTLVVAVANAAPARAATRVDPIEVLRAE